MMMNAYPTGVFRFTWYWSAATHKTRKGSCWDEGKAAHDYVSGYGGRNPYTCVALFHCKRIRNSLHMGSVRFSETCGWFFTYNCTSCACVGFRKSQAATICSSVATHVGDKRNKTRCTTRMPSWNNPSTGGPLPIRQVSGFSYQALILSTRKRFLKRFFLVK